MLDRRAVRVAVEMADDLKHKAEEMKGRAKEAAGDLTDNDDLKQEGKGDKAAAKIKQAGDSLSDKVDDAVDKIHGKS
jgi:uncharacterized protein YjbJ (UPF0337 family)